MKPSPSPARTQSFPPFRWLSFPSRLASGALMAAIFLADIAADESASSKREPHAHPPEPLAAPPEAAVTDASDQVGHPLAAPDSAAALPGPLAPLEPLLSRLPDRDALLAFYQSLGRAPAWTDATRAELAAFVASLPAHGIDPAALGRRAELPAADRTTQSESLLADLATTRLALMSVDALRFGLIRPESLHGRWKALPREPATPALLAERLSRDRQPSITREELAALAPADPRYARLQQGLAHYRALAAAGGWESLPALPETAIEPGEVYDDAPLLRVRLAAEGDLAAEAVDRHRVILDPVTTEALKRFQGRHGLEPDGILGPRSLAELNQPVASKINRLILGLERLRWLPPAPPGDAPRLEANIAEGMLRLYRREQRVDSMRIVVGVAGKTETPLFHGTLEYLIFRPYWNVPFSIASQELVPRAMRESGYFSRNGYEIVPRFGVGPNAVLPTNAANLVGVQNGRLKVRQSTGPGNALGRVKFIFPNDASVYLHDTPSRHLFKRANRDFSHGCIRVSEPARLASYLLADDGDWTEETIDEAMGDSGRPNRHVSLNRKPPVYLVYRTAYVLDEGSVAFDQDIYGHDARLLKAISALDPAGAQAP